MSVSLKRTMLAFGLLLLCLSAAVTGYEPGPSYKFEVRVKTLRKRMLLKSIQGRSGKPYAKPKASSSQRHHLHQQHRWDLRVQANGKNDEKNQHDVVFKHCDIDLIIVLSMHGKFFMLTFLPFLGSKCLFLKRKKISFKIVMIIIGRTSNILVQARY